MYTAYCPELDVVSCGRSVEEAGKNLIEAIEIQLEETDRLGTLEAFLRGSVQPNLRADIQGLDSGS